MLGTAFAGVAEGIRGMGGRGVWWLGLNGNFRTSTKQTVVSLTFCVRTCLGG